MDRLSSGLSGESIPCHRLDHNSTTSTLVTVIGTLAPYIRDGKIHFIEKRYLIKQ